MIIYKKNVNNIKIDYTASLILDLVFYLITINNWYLAMYKFVLISNRLNMFNFKTFFLNSNPKSEYQMKHN